MALPASHDWSSDGTAASLGGNWTEQVHGAQIGGTGPQVALAAVDGVEQYVYWNADSFPDDQYSWTVLFTVPNQSGPSVRMTGTGGSTAGFSLYGLGDGRVYIVQIASATPTAISADFGGSPTVGDKVEIRVSGQSPNIVLSYWKNGTQVGSSVTGITGNNSGSAGMYFHDVSAGGGRVTSWEAGALAGGADSPSPLPPRFRQMMTRRSRRTRRAS